MPDECRVIQVTNVAPTATKDQMKTLFGFIGRIADIVLYPELETSTSRICFVKYEYAEDVGVSLHLSNTVFIDRALTVLPVPNGKIPDEKTALAILTNPAGVNPVSAADELRRTIYVSNLSPSVTAEQLLELFGSQAGEVMYVRMAGDEGFGSRAAFIELTEQVSVKKALALTGQTVGGCLIHVSPANTAITKPAGTGMLGATSKELEQAMKKVDEAQPLISAVLDPDRKSRSRSRSRRSRSRGSRSKHRSRSKSRKRSRSRSHRSRRRSRSRSKRKSRSPRRRRSRSPRRRSSSKSRDRRRRSKSRSPKAGKSRRSRSQDKKKTDTKSRDNTPAGSSKDTSKRDADDKKTSKDSEKERKQSSRHRSRSPQTSRRRSKSRSKSPPRSGRKGRDERRRSRERSKEKSSRNRSTKDDAKEPELHRSRGHDGDSDRGPSHGYERESKSPAATRRDESDNDAYEPKSARNEDNASEGDGSHTEGED